MTITIWHGGQTGVDRGAHLAAVALGARVGGYMPRDGRDELGLIPADVAKHLRRPVAAGLAARTQLNVRDAHALLVIVPDVQRPYETPGTRLTLEERRIARPAMPWQVVDPLCPAAAISQWAIGIAAVRARAGLVETRLMVAGPRASRWADGEQVAAAIVRAVLEAARG